MGNLASFAVLTWAAVLTAFFLGRAVDPALVSARLVEALSGPYDFSGFWGTWMGHVRGVGAAFLVLAGTFGAGSSLALWLRLGRSGRPLFAVALGFSALALAVAGAGFAGLIHPVLLFLLALAGVALGRGRYRSAWRVTAELAAGGGPALTAILAGLAILFLFYMVMVLAPEMGWDAMTYHLLVPSLYAGAHKICMVPSSLGSFYPFTVEMWFTIGQVLGADGGAKILNFSFLPLSVLALAWLGREAGNTTAGWLAGFIFASLPATGMLSVESYNDLESASFTFLAVWASLRPSIPRIITAGILCGSAMGCKYSGIWVVPICLAAAWMGRNGRRAPFISVVGLAVLAGLVFSVWPIRNFLQTGNPVYPLLRGIFPVGGFNPYFTPAEAAKFLPPISLPDSASVVLTGLARFPFDFSVNITAIDGRFGPLLAGFLPLLLFRSRAVGRESGFLAAAGSAFAVMWVVSGAGVGRYLLPMAALLAFPSAVAVLDMASRTPALRIMTVVLVAAVSAGQLVSWTGQVTGSYSPWRVAFGAESRQLYLSRGLQPHFEYAPMARLINERLPGRARILMYSDILSYYIEREVVFDTQQVMPPVGIRLFSRRTDPAELRKMFRQLGIDWVYYTPLHVMAFQRECGCISFEPSALACYEKFWRRYAEVDFDYMGLKMFRLRSEAEAARKKPGQFVALPGVLDAVQARAEEARLAGDIAGALDALEKAAKKYPDMSEIYIRMAEMQLQRNGTAGAMRNLATARALGADSAPYWMILSSTRMMAGDRPGSLAAARECAERSPTPRALTMFAAGLANNGDIAGAREAVRRALRQAPFDEHVQNIARQLR